MSDLPELKRVFLSIVKDAVLNLIYYDRKNDDEFNCEQVDELFESGQITLKELTDAFSQELVENYPSLK
jgi:hypothetical protein